MFETPLTVVGMIVTDPIRRKVGDQEVIKFRVASNARRRNGEGNWEPGNSLFITVNCWGQLVVGVGATLARGDAVIAVGNVYTSEYEDREGARRSSLEMRATAVGRICHGKWCGSRSRRTRVRVRTARRRPMRAAELPGMRTSLIPPRTIRSTIPTTPRTRFPRSAPTG